MVIEPTHRILYCNMKIPKTVHRWNFDFSPYLWFDTKQGHLEYHCLDLFLHRTLPPPEHSECYVFPLALLVKCFLLIDSPLEVSCELCERASRECLRPCHTPRGRPSSSGITSRIHRNRQINPFTSRLSSTYTPTSLSFSPRRMG